MNFSLLKSTLSLCFLLLCLAVYAQPAYDNCADALTITVNEMPINCGGATPYTNTGSTTEPGEATASCYFNGVAVTRTVWFKFTLPAGCHVVDVRTDPTDSGLDDSQIAVYDGCNGTELACDEDGGFNNNNSFINDILPEGGTYYVQVS